MLTLAGADFTHSKWGLLWILDNKVIIQGQDCKAG